MNYYHMTSLDRLNSISKKGLIPNNENNSKLINDSKEKVFFSEGFQGAIALFVDFNIVYENIKKQKTNIANKEIEKEVLETKNLIEYLKEGVYLQFDGTDIENERNFENGCTSEIILPKKLNVCILKNKHTGDIIYSRFEIIKYMMSKVLPEEIQYYGKEYKDSPNFDNATARIQEKVKRYYLLHKNEIEKYRNEQYILEYVPIDKFINHYI